METFKKFLYLLTPKERNHASLLLVMMLIMALLDMIGVASIIPFMAVLTNPNLIETNLILKKMFDFSNIFGVENDQQFLFALGVLVFALLVISLLFKALTTYVQSLFVHMRQYSIAKRLVEGYLHQPYSWFLSRNSADLGKTILSEVGHVVGAGMNPLMEMISKTMIVIAIITLLFFTDPKLALIIGFSFSVAYGVIFKLSKGYLGKIGKENLKNNELRFTAISEAFGAAKEVKLSGLEKIYIERFSNPNKIFLKNHVLSQIIALLPRFGLEAIAFGGIILMVLYLIAQEGSINNVIPIISLYVFAGYRLMPAMQEIYGSFTRLTFVLPSLNKLYEDIKNLKPFNSNQDQGIILPKKNISLKNISYNYPNTSRTALKDISINIPVKTTVGLMGATGSGKTTTVDIILGLLEAQKGNLEIDGKIITKHNSKAWQRSIGYVPQHIYLADDTVLANIAFGVDPNNVNKEAVEKSSKIANLHDFIVDELPEKYHTTIGERGIRLSGGQRQRIGIARALYHNPQVLILDEATSALDNFTEEVVMDAVNNLGKNMTIILIAHRLSTLKKCNEIFLLEKGKLKNKGTFEELVSIKDNLNINIKT